MLSHVDGVLIYLQSFDDFHLTSSVKKSDSVLMHMQALRGPSDGWQNVLINQSLVVGDFLHIVERWGIRYMGLSQIYLHAEFILRFWTAEAEGRICKYDLDGL